MQQDLLKTNSKVSWKNVDLTREERVHVPDINPSGLGTLIDFDLHMLGNGFGLSELHKQ